MVNLHYPPKLSKSEDATTADGKSSYCEDSELEEEGLAALSQSLLTIPKEIGDEPTIDEFPVEAGTEEAEEAEKLKKERESLKNLVNLFVNCKVFLSREVPRESLVFIIRSFGGQVSWPNSVALGSTFDEKDESITHQIVDRPLHGHQYISRYYVQPQWLVDSVNYKRLLPVEDYLAGCDLPPHLSPFVTEEEGDYIPPERQAMLDEMEKMEEIITEVKKDEEEPEKPPAMTKEERTLAKMVMPKKNKRLLDKIEHSKKKKRSEATKLREKRKAYDQKKTSKKIKTK